MKIYIYMGNYYTTRDFGLVKVVARAFNIESGETMIMFSEIREGGYSSECKLMNEDNFFKNIVTTG